MRDTNILFLRVDYKGDAVTQKKELINVRNHTKVIAQLYLPKQERSEFDPPEDGHVMSEAGF